MKVIRKAELVIVAMMLSFGMLTIAATSLNKAIPLDEDEIETRENSPQDINTNDAETLLNQAIESARLGNENEAIHKFYVCFMVSQDDTLCNRTISEWTDFVAETALKSDPIRRAALLQSHWKTLKTFQDIDASNWTFSQSMQETLFNELRELKERCQRAGLQHMHTAEELFKQSKGEWTLNPFNIDGDTINLSTLFKFNDDEVMQSESLHHLNIAIQYFNQLDETSRMLLAKQFQKVRNELSTSEFEQQIGKDRIVFGSFGLNSVEQMAGVLQ